MAQIIPVCELPMAADEEQELEALAERLDITCSRYKMEICAEKTKTH